MHDLHPPPHAFAFVASPSIAISHRALPSCSRRPVSLLFMTAGTPSHPRASKIRLASNRHRSSRIPPPHDDAAIHIVTFMAIANEFSMAALYRRLLRTPTDFPGVEASAYGPILHLARRCGSHLVDAFVFAYGCIVVWGSEEESVHFMDMVVDDALQLRPAPAVDCMQFTHGPRASIRRDLITLEAALAEDVGDGANDAMDTLDPLVERLAVSCGLAQSIKLGAFESAMRATIENTRHLPEELARTGRITASRREVSRRMGRLFLDRYRYHLSGDLLMTPAFVWENEQYLPAYRRVERYLEVRERGEILNKRVEVVQELYKLLGEELSHRNSISLELAITIMIAFEILLTLIAVAKESLRGMLAACGLFFCLAVAGWGVCILIRRRSFANAAERFPKSHRDL